MNSSCRALALSLAVLAMVVRGLVPAGWMPDMDGSGRVVICTGQGPMRPASGSHRGHTLPDRGDRICPFAAAAHQSPPPAFAAAPKPIPSGLHVAQAATAERVLARRLYARHSPRAPPPLT
ncbi:MAG TPA: DUF2946 family protein [Rhizomicrobium sp.]|jgi:hypothetical protein|nr:DUF2946 family protein [Rhizomicrobium sp.]